MTKSSDFLTTKFLIPAARVDRIQRTRLLDRLDAGLNHKLTLIAAPAGFGKTTLLSTWVAERLPTSTNHYIGWLALDEAANTPSGLITQIIAACHVGGMMVGKQTLTLIHAEPPPAQRVILTALLNDLSALPRTKPEHSSYLLVIEDLHLVNDAQTLAAIEFLIENLPSFFHIILTSRSEPALPLARWRARHQMADLYATDLCFSAAETAEFLTRTTSVMLTSEQIRHLHAHTEGWPAALQLLALTIRTAAAGGADLATLPASDNLLYDFFALEVLRAQPTHVQDFLLKTSILTSLNGPLCDAVCAAQGSDALLRQVVSATLLVQPCDSAGAWHRLHPLLRGFLYRRLQQHDAEEVRRLHQRAAAWFLAQGDGDAAIAHALAGGALDQAAQCVAVLAHALLRRGEIPTLRRWLALLPEAQILADPRLYIVQIWTLLDSYRLAAATRYLNMLHAVSSSTRDPVLQSQLLALNAVAAAMGYQPEQALAAAHQAEEALAEIDAALQPYVVFSLALAYRMAFDVAQAEQALRQAAALAAANENLFIETSAWANLANLYFDLGRLDDAKQANRRLIELLCGAPALAQQGAGASYVDLARIEYERNALSAAAAQIQQARQLCAAAENQQALVRALLVQTQIQQAQGDERAARATLEEADQIARRAADSLMVDSVVRRRVTLALHNRRLQEARQWAQTLPESGDPYPFFTAITWARLHLAEDQPGQALEYLGDAWAGLAQTTVLHLQLQVLALEAVAYQALRQPRAAEAKLLQALNLAAPHGFIRTFVDIGRPLGDLLRTAALPSTLAAYSGVLLAAFAGDAPPSTSVLTPREQQILGLLRAGLSNRAMAAELVISEATLKRHLSNLYLKLGVHSRTEALAHAAAH